MRWLLSRISLVLLLLWIAAAPARAASAWTPLGPYGGTVWNVVADPVHAGVVYAIAPAIGLFKSVDRGESWTRLAGAPEDCVALALDPAHPKVLYASSLWVHKSLDGGATWALASQGLPAPFVTRALAVDPESPSRLYLGSLEKGLWRSGDGGASWQPASQGLPDGDGTSVTVIAVPRRPRGAAFAGTSRGLYRTLSYGTSWELVSLPAGRVNGLAVAPSDPGTVYAALDYYGIARSTDGGASWTGVPGPGPSSIYSLAVDPRSSRIVYAGTSAGLYKSVTAGRSWTRIEPGITVYVAGVTIDPLAPDRVYAALYASGFEIGGVLRSSDAGRHWGRSNAGINGLPMVTAAVGSGDPGWLLGGANNSGLFRSSNGGRRWVRSPIPREGPLINIQSLAASPEAPGTFVATIYSGDLVWKTDDGGLSWTRYSDFHSMWGIVRFAPSSADTFYVMNRKGIFRGTMADSSLVTMSASPLECAPGDLAVVPGDSRSGPPWLYAAGVGRNAPRCTDNPRRSQVVRSTDGGATWLPADTGLPGEWVAGLAVDPEDSRKVYVRIGNDITGSAKGYGVWKSEDGGATWRQAGEELRGTFLTALDALPGRLFAATSEGKVFRSQDGGESWQERGEGLPAVWVYQFLATPASPGRVYAVTTRGLWTLEDEP